MNYLNAIAHLLCCLTFARFAHQELNLKRPNKWEVGIQVGAAILFGTITILNLV